MDECPSVANFPTGEISTLGVGHDPGVFKGGPSVAAVVPRTAVSSHRIPYPLIEVGPALESQDWETVSLNEA